MNGPRGKRVSRNVSGNYSRPARHLWTGLIVVAPAVLSGCQGYYTVGPRIGAYDYDIHRFNRLVQEAEPGSSHRWQTLIAGDGSRAVSVYERYRSGDVSKQVAPLKKKAAEQEQKIAALETKIAEWEKVMMDPAFFQKGTETKAGMEAYKAAQSDLETLFASWTALTEEIAQIEAGA